MLRYYLPGKEQLITFNLYTIKGTALQDLLGFVVYKKNPHSAIITLENNCFFAATKKEKDMFTFTQLPHKVYHTALQATKSVLLGTLFEGALLLLNAE